MKVLIIDDSRATRSMIRMMIQKIGPETCEAENGKEALDVLKQNWPLELALVDWNMPVMSGYEFICEVRKNPTYNDLKLMMVTTETELEQVVKAMEAGANEYLMKPFTKDMIEEKLNILGLV